MHQNKLGLLEACRIEGLGWGSETVWCILVLPRVLYMNCFTVYEGVAILQVISLDS